jgi:DNA-directed RNA polymerase subunit RPC12/RpoP
MGYPFGSEFRQGFKCFKCGKKLIYYRKLKGHDPYDKVVGYVMARKFVRLIWDPSEGKSSGYKYGYLCQECWRKDERETSKRN